MLGKQVFAIIDKLSCCVEIYKIKNQVMIKKILKFIFCSQDIFDTSPNLTKVMTMNFFEYMRHFSTKWTG